MLLDDIEDQDNILIVHIPDSKRKKPRRFVIVDEGNLALYRRNVALHPVRTPHRRLFVNYKQGKCSIQSVGLHSFGKFFLFFRFATNFTKLLTVFLLFISTP
jgi:hypothetical protein